MQHFPVQLFSVSPGNRCIAFLSHSLACFLLMCHASNQVKLNQGVPERPYRQRENHCTLRYSTWRLAQEESA
ncbi:hypothetical protein Y1Q_0014265 [Alligator mississippiensis]|uniref:Uncharacterized protein n=1 Tax=Alligator mississippiensis TaxID=8496 RepID=A0A151LZJ8_ALLMI|nr:hypothetical protein Y1Q_0014265 [Alligator mississippiensis]